MALTRIRSVGGVLSAGERQARCGRCRKLLGEFLVVDGTIRCPRCKFDNEVKMRSLNAAAVDVSGNHAREAMRRG